MSQQHDTSPGRRDPDRPVDPGKQGSTPAREEENAPGQPRRISQEEMQKYVPQDRDPDDPVSP